MELMLELNEYEEPHDSSKSMAEMRKDETYRLVQYLTGKGIDGVTNPFEDK